MRTLALLISGHVQGVGYRDRVRQQALTLGLSGWVRNLRDGRVEAVASGADDAVARFIEVLRTGPPLARVDRVEQSPCDEVSASGFEIRPTA